MSDRVIEQADLRTIEHNLGAIHNDLQTLDSNVGAVNSNIKVVYDEIGSLAKEFHDFVSVQQRANRLNQAETRLVKIRQELVIYALSDFLIMIVSWLVKQSLRAFLFQEVQL